MAALAFSSVVSPMSIDVAFAKDARSGGSSVGDEYQNPVIGPSAPDPYVVRVGNAYFAYSSSAANLNIPVWSSRDLTTWSAPTEALPTAPAWADGTLFYWSPGILVDHGRYVMYYAVMHQSFGQVCISAAVSTSPSGPFTDDSTHPLVCQTGLGGSIDPSPFIDRDGTPWLVWKSNGDSPTCGCLSSLWSQRLAPDHLRLVGARHRLLTVAEPWEQPLIEGPQLVRAGRVYYLLYAGNWWDTAQYAIGLATCATPAGPCARLSVTAPFVQTSGLASGPGGPVVFDAYGHQWLGYHAWTTGAVATAGSGRAMRIDRLDLPDAGKPRTDAPTTSREPLRTAMR
jgi:beta-xylosidase